MTVAAISISVAAAFVYIALMVWQTYKVKTEAAVEPESEVEPEPEYDVALGAPRPKPVPEPKAVPGVYIVYYWSHDRKHLRTKPVFAQSPGEARHLADKSEDDYVNSTGAERYSFSKIDYPDEPTSPPPKRRWRLPRS